MKNVTFLIDLDGTVLDTAIGVIKSMGEIARRLPEINLRKILFQSGARFETLAARIMESKAFSRVPACPGVKEALYMLGSKGSIEFVTASPDSEKAKQNRRENMEYLGLGRYTLHFDRFKSDRSELLSSLPEDYILLDDSITNCNAARKLGRPAAHIFYWSRQIMPLIQTGRPAKPVKGMTSYERLYDYAYEYCVCKRL
ncbi:MAG: hypothetical protein LBL52_02330 [Rickettsiales bacterium]|jgi:hypothetical protein|nr:hypothetical protein [Rickettsiales bacterium]